MTEYIKRSIAEKQAWKPRWEKDDVGDVLFGYETQVVPSELNDVRDELRFKGISFVTEPGNRIAIGIPGIDAFESAYPQFAARKQRGR